MKKKMRRILRKGCAVLRTPPGARWPAWLALGVIVGVTVGLSWAAERRGGGDKRAAAAPCPTPSWQGVSPPSRPNIVVIMTDDQDARSMWVMSHVQELLGTRGTTFANSFVSTPLCCPSRATFLTGQYAHNHKVRMNTLPLGGYLSLDHDHTLPVWLQGAGYRTAHIGKYLNGYGIMVPPATIPPGWTEWYGLVDPSYYNYTVNENGTLRQYGESPEDYQTDVLARYAVRFIEQAATLEETPFFLWVAFLAPHRDERREVLKSIVPAPRHQGLFAEEPLPRPPSFNERDVSDKPLWVRLLPPLSPKEVAFIIRDYRRRLEALLAVDEAVRDLVAALERTGQLDNTLLIYTSDNAFFLGEHRIPTGKDALYEEAIRVPLLMRGPGIPAACVLDHLVVNIDLAPTIVDVSGALAGLATDGRSLMPLLHKPPSPWRAEFLIEDWVKKTLPTPTFVGVRTSRYSYIETAEGFGKAKELYDLATDPFQLENLMQKRHRHEYREVITYLQSRLRELRTCAGADCF